MRLEGHCHCAAIRVIYDTPASLQELAPRRCGCDFCTRHGAQWHSSPAGRLVLSGKRENLQDYRFGTETADFHLCRHCGVVLAATSDIDGSVHAVVNLAVMGIKSLPESQAADFDTESLEERLQRRASRWIPDVEFHLA